MVGGVVLLALVALGANYAALYIAQDTLANRLRADSGARSASVAIRSEPFLWDLAVKGHLAEVDVSASSVPAGPLVLSRVSLRAQGVTLDEPDLRRHLKVRVVAVDSATVSISVSPADLEAALERSFLSGVVSLAGGNLVRLGSGPLSLLGHLEVLHGDVLALVVGAHTLLSITLSSSDLVPDCPFALAANAESITLSCQVSPVPSKVIAAIDAASARA